jgi:uncharacterized membrane protein YhaH (DUF805 family)
LQFSTVTTTLSLEVTPPRVAFSVYEVVLVGLIFMFFKGHKKENRFGNNPQELETT